MITAVSDSYFVRVGSRSTKPSNTIHVMDEARPHYTGSHDIEHGTAHCGVQVRSMSFDHLPEEFRQSLTCKRCARRVAAA